MFDFVRSHRSWMMLFILVLILPSFVFFGIQGYNSYVEQEGALATVDGAPIRSRNTTLRCAKSRAPAAESGSQI